MKRKLAKVALLFLMLMCLMGASSIDWDAKSPTNPAKLKINGTGPYTVDPSHTFISIAMWSTIGNLSYDEQATTANGKWDATETVFQAGTYKCWASLYVTDGQKIWPYKTPTEPQIDVK